MKLIRMRCARALVAIVLALAAAAPARAQLPLGTGFTFQGELASAGGLASGAYDFRFRLYDGPAAGAAQIGPLLCLQSTAVVGGRFAAELDFGPAFGGDRRYLEIEVRASAGLGCANSAGFTVLSPRQALSGTPNAMFAATAAALSGPLPPAALAGTYSGVVNLSNAGNVLAGSGGAITNLSAGNISSGRLDAARMPENWVAGGDLVGSYPNPVIAPGAVTDAKISSVGWGKVTGTPFGSVASSARVMVAWGDTAYGQTTVPALTGTVTYVSAAMGDNHTVALRSDGTVAAWGNNDAGQTTVPALSAGVSYTAVAAGDRHSLALRSDGAIAAFGYNNYGQTVVPAPGAGVTYTGVACGNLHSIGLRSDGSAVAWGNNDFGQCTIPAPGAGKSYIAAAGGALHTLLLRSDGVVVALGNGDFGQLAVPALAAGQSYTAVAAGYTHGLALRNDGVVVAWGNNSSGQTTVPVLAAGQSFTAVAAGYYHSIALRNDGVAMAWGNSGQGRTTAPVLPTGEKYVFVTAGGSHSGAIRNRPVGVSLDVPLTANAFFGNGSGLVGVAAATATVASNATQLGGQPAAFYSNAANLTGVLPAAALLGTYGNSLTLNNPGNVFTGSGAGLTLLNAASISSGTLAVARMPTTWTAGGDLTGTLPSPTIAPGAVTDAKIASVSWLKLTGAPFTSVAAGRLMNGWGRNSDGQSTVPALPAGVTYSSAAAGRYHSLGLRSDGTVAAWGMNVQGQTAVPALATGVTYTAVAAGDYHSLALRSDGTVAAWGFGTSGQTTVPALSGGLSYTAIAGGFSHSLAVRSDGTVAAWGFNGDGQTTVPALTGGLRYSAVAGGGNHSLALRSDGSVAAWGRNTEGQTTVPALPNGVSYTAVAAGFSHSVGLRSDGSVVAWGRNVDGQTTVPVLPVGTTYTAISAGYAHSVALRSDGVIVGWGSNGDGQLTAPVIADSYTGLATGGFHTLGIRNRSASLSVDGPLTATALVGSGAGITGVNAAQLGGQPLAFYTSASNITSGTLSDAQLSANVAVRNAANNFGNFANTFGGNVGIGSGAGTPGAALHVATGAIAGGWQVRLTNASPGASGFEAGMRASDSGFLELTNQVSGAAGVARLGSSGAWTVSSDRRLKTDISPATGNLDAALKLRPVHFTWLAGGAAGKTDLGLIAQEVRDVLPVFVAGDEAKETLSVNYAQLSVVAIGAVQELKVQSDLMRAENAALRAENAAVRRRLDALEAAAGEEKMKEKR